MHPYQDLVPMRSLIPKVIDKITMDNWFRDSESLQTLIQQLRIRFGHQGLQVGQVEYIALADKAEKLAVDLVLRLSYGDLLQLLCENPWMLNTETEPDLGALFSDKFGRATVASMVAVVLCEHLYAELMQSIECLI